MEPDNGDMMALLSDRNESGTMTKIPPGAARVGEKMPQVFAALIRLEI